MPKGKYYAVRSGRNTGVYDNWSDCRDQVNQYSGQEYKSFSSKAEADAYMSGGSSSSGPYGGSYGSSSSRSYSRSSYSGLYDGSSHSGSTRSARSTPSSSSSNRNVQEVYTDGSCIGNGKSGAKAGWGAYWGDHRDSYGQVNTSTNNAGELTAIKETLKEINRNPGNKDYKIYSDSEYSIRSTTDWGDKWSQQGWKTSTGTEVKNQGLIKEIRGLMDESKSRGINVELAKVKGHANVPGNEAADRLARRGAGQR